MSSQTPRSSYFLGDNVDILLAKIGLLACILLLSLRLLAEQVLLVVIPLAGSSAFGLYILTRRDTVQKLNTPTISHTVAGYLPAAVLVAIAAMVLLVTAAGGRTPAIHLLTGAIGVGILLQVILVDEHPFPPVVVLFQLVVAAIAIRFSAVLASPGLVGVDIWTHVLIYIEGIAEEGSLAAIADDKYVMAPLYHLNGAIAALVFDSGRLGLFLTMGTLLAAIGLAIYCTARLLVPPRWALLAAGMYTFADQVVRWGIHLIPTSLGLLFFTGALYALTKLYFRYDIRVLGLLFAFSLAIVFTHQVSTAVILLLLAIAALVTSLVVFTPLANSGGACPHVALGIVGTFLATLVITVLSWANTPFSQGSIFLWRMLEVLEDTIAHEAGFLNLAGEEETGEGVAEAPAHTETLDLLVPLIEWFGFALLLLSAIIGGIVFLRWAQPTDLSLTYLVTAAAMFVIIYGFSLFGIRTIMPGRWLAFMFAPMVIIGAVGLYYLADNAGPAVVLAVFLVIALGYPMTMMVADRATFDSPMFEEQNPRFAYTEEELAAVETIGTVRSPVVEEPLETDHPYQSLYNRLVGYDTEPLHVIEGEPATASPVVAREYQLTAAAGVSYSQHIDELPVGARSYTVLEESACVDSRNHLYTNDQVTLCTVSSSVSVPGGGP